MKEVFLLRHGQTEENTLGILIGQRNPPLSDQGRRDVYSIQPCIPKPDIVFSSDLQRAAETARILFPDHQIVLLPQLREQSFGQFEGQPRNKLRTIGHTLTHDLNTQDHGVEKPEAVISRASAVLQLIRDTPAKRIMVVGHGAFFRSMIALLLPNHPPPPTLKNLQYHHFLLANNGQVSSTRINQSWK